MNTELVEKSLYHYEPKEDLEISSKIMRINTRLSRPRIIKKSARRNQITAIELQKKEKSMSMQLNTRSHLYEDRISYNKLETCYFDHPLANRGVNMIITEILSAGYTIQSEDEKAKEKIEEWISNLTKPFRTLMEMILQNCLVGGNCFLELILDMIKEIRDLAVVPAGTMDFQRNLQGKILRNPKTKEPVGWVQIDEEFFQNSVKFDYDDIVHFQLYKLSNDPLAMGIIESAYSVFTNLRKIEDAYAEALYRHGYPNWDITIGTIDIPASAEDITDADDIAEDIVSGADVFKHGPLLKIDKVESMRMDKITAQLDYFIYLVCAAFGIPKGELLGTGEGTNRATAKELALAKEKHIKALQSTISEIFQENIFKRVLKTNYNIEEDVWIEFAEIRPEDQTSKIERVKMLAEVGLITPDFELENYFREQEDLPLIKEQDFLPKGDSDSNLPPQAPPIEKKPKPEDEESPIPPKEQMTDEEKLERNRPYSSVEPILRSYLRVLKGKFTTLKNTLRKRVVLDKERIEEILKEYFDILKDDLEDTVKEYIPKAFKKGQDITIDDILSGTKKQKQKILQAYSADVHLLVSDQAVMDHLVKQNLGYVNDLSNTLRDQIFRSLSEGLEANETIEQLRMRISTIFSTDMKVPRKAYDRRNPDGSITKVAPGELTISLIRRLEMIATEETRESFRQSRIQYYTEKRPDLDSLMWVATLRNSCADCRALHRKVFPKNRVPDRPHPDCECTVAATRAPPKSPTKIKLPITGKPKFDRSAS